MLKSLTKLFSTFFYVGYFPLIPGTAGSLAAIIIYLLVKDNPPVYFTLTLILLALGFLASTEMEKLAKRRDPPCVVIDEVCGMLLALAFLPYDIKLVILAFVVFRLLDTLKPFPIGWFERLKGGWGIMSDDIVAGIYTNIVLQLAVRLVSLSGS